MEPVLPETLTEDDNEFDLDVRAPAGDPRVEGEGGPVPVGPRDHLCDMYSSRNLGQSGGLFLGPTEAHKNTVAGAHPASVQVPGRTPVQLIRTTSGGPHPSPLKLNRARVKR
jgi:hypothetical protein